MAATAPILRAIPLFQGMTDRSIDEIGGLARPIAFASGEDLVRQGDPGDTFIVLTDGSAEVRKDGVVRRSLMAGDFLGEISLFDGGPRSATVTATSDVEGLVITRAGFDRLMTDFPVVRHDVVSALTQRVRQRAPEITD